MDAINIDFFIHLLWLKQEKPQYSGYFFKILLRNIKK